jgi:endonuclease/exonuclease/phosphatase family metal-dependent hydrolase
MNKWFHILIFGILLGCGNVQNIRTVDSDAGNAASGTLKFMTLNIRAAGGMQNPLQGAGGVPGGGLPPPITNPGIVEETKTSLMRFAATIKSVNPDIIGLQEVRGIHQAKFLAEESNLNYVYAVHAREHWWGLAVLSKYKIVGTSTKIINLGGPHGDRIALICYLDANGRKLTIVNVDFAQENFRGQVQETLPLVNPLEGPAVLLGDFSRPPEYAQMMPIRETLTAACEAAKGYEGRCIDPVYGKVDYIFFDRKNFSVLDAAAVSMQPRDNKAPTGAWATMKLTD